MEWWLICSKLSSKFFTCKYIIGKFILFIIFHFFSAWQIQMICHSLNRVLCLECLLDLKPTPDLKFIYAIAKRCWKNGWLFVSFQKYLTPAAMLSLSTRVRSDQERSTATIRGLVLFSLDSSIVITQPCEWLIIFHHAGLIPQMKCC